MSPYAYNSSNELNSTPSATFTYDGNGNTLTKLDSTGTTTYNWDFENRLISVTLPGTSGTVTFKYDPLGRRIQKSSSNSITNFLYAGRNSVAEVTAAGALLATYAHVPGIDDPAAEVRGSSVDYFEQDGLGSITSLSDPTQTLANTYTYGAFGTLTASTGAFTNPFQYTGRDFDSETGLRYYRARYYDSSYGRFISEDPVAFEGGNNFYSYVKNNVTNTLDPLGLAQCFYRISAHTLTCVGNKDHKNIARLGPNGLKSGVDECKDKPECSKNGGKGPIPPGFYRMNSDDREGHDRFFRLEPDPPVPGWEVDLGIERGGFELHPGTISLGCITADKNNQKTMQQYDKLFQLLDSEDGNNWLLVAP